jgi:hypothetical protein
VIPYPRHGLLAAFAESARPAVADVFFQLRPVEAGNPRVALRVYSGSWAQFFSGMRRRFALRVKPGSGSGARFFGGKRKGKSGYVRG